ncbi:MAG: four helix bundle protein, partial [Bacteroidota bacterium]
MRNFRALNVWQDAIKLVKEIYLLTKALPQTEKFGLISQMQRCAISIPVNIPEGCGKNSNKDFARFLQISLGSIYELETHLILCSDLGFVVK